MTTPSACLVLPFPPSVNHLFAGKARRYVSPAYKAWRAEAGYSLVKQRPLPTLTGPVELDIALGKPDAKRRDCSNYIKAVEDFLVEPAGILEDDSQVERITVYWCPETTGCRVYVASKTGGGA